MVGEQVTPAAGRSIAGGADSGSFAAQGFDLQRYSAEVAQEIGVDPINLEAYGLSAQKIDALEKQLHSRAQRDGQGGSQ